MDFIAGLPKCELHVHLEGTLEPGLHREIARRNWMTVGQEQLGAGERFGTLTTFLAAYYDAMQVLLTEQDFADLTTAYLEKAHEQGVIYCEIFFDPQAHTSRGVSFDTVINGIREAQIDVEEAGGVRSQLIMCFLRDHPVWSAEETLEAALRYREWIVGVGLDSDERGNPPSKFAGVFARAKAEGFHITMHCDPNQDGSLENIKECLDLIGVERIDHGVNCLEDEAVCDEIKARGLGLTVCPLSNRKIYGDLMAKQIRMMLDRGLRVTCNSDDPAYFDGYIGDNLRALEASGLIDRSDIVALTRNAFEVAWLPRPERDLYLAAVDQYVEDNS